MMRDSETRAVAHAQCQWSRDTVVCSRDVAQCHGLPATIPQVIYVRPGMEAYKMDVLWKAARAYLEVIAVRRHEAF